MSYSGTNQWGPYTTQTTEAVWPTYAPGDEYPFMPGGTGVNPGPPAVPQSPSGVISGAGTNSPATWNYAHSETSTQYYLDTVLNVYAPQQGTLWLTGVKVAADIPNNFSSRFLVNLGN